MQSVVYNSKANASADTTPIHNFSSASKMLKYQHIAPAPPLQSASNDLKLMPRKYTPRATNVPYGVDQTQSVQRRNARERNRVKQVNNSFAKLRQHIPQSIISDLTKGGGRGPHKKISKVDTLRIAVEYIRRLQDLVEDRSGIEGSGSNNSSNFLSTDTFSNISFSSSTSSSSSSSSSEVGSSPSPPLPVTTTTASTKYYTQTTSPNALPTFSQQQHFSSSLLTPVSLKSYPVDEGCASPTSSFNSSMSFDSGTFEPAPQLASHHGTDAHLDAHLQLKFEPYDAFHLQEEDCQPDDEEILDYISLWQEQQ